MPVLLKFSLPSPKPLQAQDSPQMGPKRLLKALASALFFLCALLPQAQAQDEVTSLDLNQPYNANKLGSLTLPFMWQIAEDNERIVSTEKRDNGASIITIDLLDLPSKLDSAKLANQIQDSIAAQLQLKLDHSEQQSLGLNCSKDGKNCKNQINALVSKLSNEQQACALLLIPNLQKLLALSFCAPLGRNFAPSPEALLVEIFKGMK